MGENGAGKTTFVKLLTRLYDPTEGVIRMDGIPIQEYDYDSYMSAFSAVFQDYRLFSFSLEENVTLARPAEEGRAEDALRRAGLGEKLDESVRRGSIRRCIRTLMRPGLSPPAVRDSGSRWHAPCIGTRPSWCWTSPTAALDPRAEFELYRHFNELDRRERRPFIFRTGFPAPGSAMRSHGICRLDGSWSGAPMRN